MPYFCKRAILEGSVDYIAVEQNGLKETPVEQRLETRSRCYLLTVKHVISVALFIRSDNRVPILHINTVYQHNLVMRVPVSYIVGQAQHATSKTNLYFFCFRFGNCTLIVISWCPRCRMKAEQENDTKMVSQISQHYSDYPFHPYCTQQRVESDMS